MTITKAILPTKLKSLLAFLLSGGILLGAVVSPAFATLSTQHLVNMRDAEVLLATPESAIGKYPVNVEVIIIGSKEVRLLGYNPSQLN